MLTYTHTHAHTHVYTLTCILTYVVFHGVQVHRVDDGSNALTVLPRYVDDAVDDANVLRVVYDHGPVSGFKWDSFDTVRARVADQWPRTPKKHDVVSAPLKDRIKAWVKNFDDNYEKMIGV